MGQNQIKSVSNTQLKKIVSSTKWILNNGKYRRLQCKPFFKQCKKLPKITILDFSNSYIKEIGANNEQAIPEQIAHINFSSFLCLNLSGNGIYSIQKLTFLDMKNLETLIIEWNFISSLESFHKTNFKNLQILLLGNNPLINYGQFQRTKHKKLQQIQLQKSRSQSLTISNILNIIPKSNTPQLYLLNCSSSKRIDITKSKLHNSIKRKFNHHLKFARLQIPTKNYSDQQ